jgi:hypothetical protein
MPFDEYSIWRPREKKSTYAWKMEVHMNTQLYGLYKYGDGEVGVMHGMYARAFLHTIFSTYLE